MPADMRIFRNRFAVIFQFERRTVLKCHDELSFHKFSDLFVTLTFLRIHFAVASYELDCKVLYACRVVIASYVNIIFGALEVLGLNVTD